MDKNKHMDLLQRQNYITATKQILVNFAKAFAVIYMTLFINYLLYIMT